MEKNKLGVIIFSRMNSSRLPGKALMPIGGIPLLERVINRAKLTGFPVYLATSNENSDDILEELAHQNNIGCYRGSLNNVLERGLKAAQYFELNAFARLCGDRPLFSIEEMKTGLEFYLNNLPDNSFFPDLITNFCFGAKIKGLTTEIITTNALLEILRRTDSPAHLEHLSSFIYQNPTEFNILSIREKEIQHGFINCAIDTTDDYSLFDKIFYLEPSIGLSIENAYQIYLNLDFNNVNLRN